MKLPKVTRKDLDTAFAKEDDFQVQLDSKKGLVKDEHWSIRYQYDFEKKPTKCGDIWKGNRKEDTCYAIWYDFYNYMCHGGMTDEDILAKSETEKVLFQGKNYKISLIRDYIESPTDTCWGYKIVGVKYALFNKKNEIVYKDDKKWRFEEVVLNGYAEKELVVNSFIDEIKIDINPFKCVVVNITDQDKVNDLSDKFEISIDRPDKKSYYDKFIKDKNYWVVFLIGMPEFERLRRRNTTWFLVNSKTKPTVEECFYDLSRMFEQYTADNKFTKYLNYIKEEYQMDLNKVDLELEERVHDVFNNKFDASFCNVFGIKDRNKVLKYVEEDFNK